MAGFLLQRVLDGRTRARTLCKQPLLPFNGAGINTVKKRRHLAESLLERHQYSAAICAYGSALSLVLSELRNEIRPQSHPRVRYIVGRIIGI